MDFLKEFKEFAVKGNVMDMAIGVIIGAAFGKIITSLVSDIIMPVIGVLTNGIDFKDLKITIKEAIENSPAVTINYGIFIQTIIDFVIIAFCIFIAIKLINKLKREKEEAVTEAPKEEILILKEIRDLLKK